MRLGKAIAALLAFLLVLPVAASLGAEQKPLKIGVVNLTKVFEGYKKKQHLEEELRSVREQKTRVLRQKSDEIMRLREEIKMLELGSEERKRKESLLQQKQLDFRNFNEVTASNLLEQKLDVTRTLYEDIIKAISAYGKRENFDLIIKVQDIDTESRTLDELLYKINQHIVLYNAERIDITQDILDILNDYYSKEIIEK